MRRTSEAGSRRSVHGDMDAVVICPSPSSPLFAPSSWSVFYAQVLYTSGALLLRFTLKSTHIFTVTSLGIGVERSRSAPACSPGPGVV